MSKADSPEHASTPMAVGQTASDGPDTPVASRRRGHRIRPVSIEVEVPFHDVDALRIVWHGHYYKYLELARTRLVRECGLDLGDLIGPQYRFLMIESGCRYAAPLTYGDRVRVDAWFWDVAHRLNIGYEVTNLSRGQRAARGHTVLATTDIQGRLLLRTPDAILERIGVDIDGRERTPR
jgi:acyl-CoA thioester hydrolase